MSQSLLICLNNIAECTLKPTMIYRLVNALGLPTCKILDLTSMNRKAVP